LKNLEKCLTLISGSQLKNEFWFKVKAAVRFRPEEYNGYFEDLNRAANAEIGPKGFFALASKQVLGALALKQQQVNGGQTCV